MSQGFVYIMINLSFIDQVKIGLTKENSEKRASDLSKPTGVPTPFIVIYDELVSNCEAVEKMLHQRFAGYRVNKSREFFRIPIKEAIKGLQNEAKNFPIGDIEDSQKVEILPQLEAIYKNYLKPDIKSVKIIHLDNVCFLETTRQTHQNLRDEIIERIDLDFIVEGTNGSKFRLDKSAKENAKIFIEEMDEYSLIMCTNLFTESACLKIDEQHREVYK